MPIDADAVERLRKLRSLGVRQGARDLARPAATRQAEPPAETGLPGQVIDTRHGPCWACTTRYSLADEPDLAELLSIPAEAFAAVGRDPALLSFGPGTAAYLDTETTGLSLGTGTYTFLIGIGRFEPDPAGGLAFVVRQYFMRDPSEERAQLHLVEEALNRCDCLVSFNGRSFDWPLVAGRFTLAGAPLPLAGAPHLDLLPPARRLWRAHFGSCSLGELERQVLSVQRTAADVPGWMIPGIYQDYYRTGGGAGATELMARVFYHNLTDIVSMARLAAHAGRLFQQPALFDHLHVLHPIECASLARCYEALEWHDAGEAAYRAALAGDLPDDARAETFRCYSLWLKRTGRRAEAAEVWETWITSLRDPDLLPYVELAKHHEWHTGDLASARTWTAWAIHITRKEGVGRVFHADLAADLERRLARLERKLAGKSEDSAASEE